jgi:hypothetical protein
MTTRRQQVEQVAGIMADWPEDWDLAAEAERQNPLGWCFETSAPLGHRIRHEGVVLTETELTRAVMLAEAYMVG